MDNEIKGAQRVGQEQVQSLLFSEKLSWQAIIYDLINSEQLDPWDIDISLLSQKYLERVRELESANFFVSSKVLLAAALLLRIKSEILLNRDIPGLDDILFGRKEERHYAQERIELEDEIPELIARTPLPRAKKISLQELMAALGKAIKTENRRIERIVVAKQYEMEANIVLPKQRIDLRSRIRGVYGKLRKFFKNREEKLAFSELIGNSKNFEDKIFHFIPLLHLDSQHKIWLEQDGHLAEIWILLKEIYKKKNAVELERMRKEVNEAFAEISEELKNESNEELKGESVFDDLKEERKRASFEGKSGFEGSGVQELEDDEVEYENPFGEKRF